MMDCIKHGIIGMGSVSRDHIKSINPIEGMRVAAIYDRKPSVLFAKGEELHIQENMRFSDYKEMLASPNVDSVSICTPNFQHYEMVKNAIENRKPFAVEKPLALNYEQTIDLYRLQEKVQVKHMICFSYRFMPSARFAKYLVENGELGEIRHVFASYCQGWGNDMERPISWRFQKELAGYGALGDLGSHIIDLIRFIVGEFDSVNASMGTFVAERIMPNSDEFAPVSVDDYAVFLAKFLNGAVGTVSATRFAYGFRNMQRIEIYGSKGGLIYKQDLINGELVDSLEVCIGIENLRKNKFEKISIPERFKCSEMEAFYKRLHGDESGMAATIKDALICQIIMDAVYNSSAKGHWEKVYLPL